MNPKRGGAQDETQGKKRGGKKRAMTGQAKGEKAAQKTPKRKVESHGMTEGFTRCTRRGAVGRG